MSLDSTQRLNSSPNTRSRNGRIVPMPDSSERTPKEEFGLPNILEIESVSSIPLERAQARKLLPSGPRHSSSFRAQKKLAAGVLLRHVCVELSSGLSANRPEGIPKSLGVQSGRTANKWKVLFILKQK